jgi:Spy/CpxP family protein refolding chaperone
MKKRIIVAVSISALLIAAIICGVVVKRATAATEKQAGDGPFSHPFARVIMARVAHELDLTAAQQSAIKAIITNEFAAARPLFEKMAENRKQMLAATAGGQFDEAQVRALAEQQAQVVTELIVAKERAKAKVYQELTPEQRAKADQMLEHLGPPPGGPFSK